jgi:predicted phage baseplate assembly protein
VATVRTGDTPAISFVTEEDLVIWPPTLRECLFSSDDTSYADYSERLRDGDEFDAFQRTPLPGDALYFGFPEDLGAHIVSLAIDCNVEGIGVDPRDPPLSWEAWCGEVRGWVRAAIERDGTGGLNQQGSVTLFLPSGMQARVLLRQAACWVRVRLVQARPRQPTYSASPRIKSIAVTSIGGTARATHSTVIAGQLLGRATGVPGEIVYLENTPVLPRQDNEYVEAQDESGAWVAWQEVQSFRDSGPGDRHYQLDGVAGAITFGPTIRQPDGAERAFGATPPRGAPLRMTRYRVGGGVTGNVGANTLTVLKSSIPYVARVANRQPASGGLDPESLDAARMRAPSALRTRDRAVTAGDYEFLALEASRWVARARCIPARGEGSATSAPPGTVELLIVPLVPPGHPRTVDALQPPPDLVREVRTYLDDRRLLGTSLVVDGPAYLGVSVEASIVVERHADAELIRNNVARRLSEYFDPLTGGADGRGWPFGRDLYLAEAQAVVQSVPGVLYAEDVTLYQVDLQTRQSRAAGQKITLAEDVLLLPLEHVVTAVPRAR